MHTETIDINAVIINVCNQIKDTSYNEKTQEERDNEFLDAINSFKTGLISRTIKLNVITENIEKISWFGKLNEESLKLLNGLIASARDLHSILIRHYIDYNKTFANKGIAKNEIREFKHSLNAFKEVYEDLEDVFFFLPKDSEFTDITKKLEDL